jgi:hypothetical protein
MVYCQVKRQMAADEGARNGKTLSKRKDEHGPPHFHAVYGEYEVTVEIETGVVTGTLPRRALGLVLEWNALHKDELLENWGLARQGRPLRRIAPLE